MSTYNEEWKAKHANDKKVWELHDGSHVSHATLKRMFGKIPTPAQRYLLGITRIAT